MADVEPTTKLHTVELDIREIRSLHFSATVMSSALRRVAEENHEDPIPLPDGRRVHACDSAVMKLELLLLMNEGEGLEGDDDK